MGNLIILEDSRAVVGDVSLGRWRQMRKLLPLLVEFLNDAAARGSFPPRVVPPEPGPFDLRRIIRDESEQQNEIFILSTTGLSRLFAWFDVLSTFDGASELYAPLVEALRLCTAKAF